MKQLIIVATDYQTERHIICVPNHFQLTCEVENDTFVFHLMNGNEMLYEFVIGFDEMISEDDAATLTRHSEDMTVFAIELVCNDLVRFMQTPTRLHKFDDDLFSAMSFDFNKFYEIWQNLLADHIKYVTQQEITRE